MATNGNKTYSTVRTYRIWGGTVNPEGDNEQRELYNTLQSFAYEGMQNYFWIPSGANHGDTQTLGIDNALDMILHLDFGKDQ